METVASSPTGAKPVRAGETFTCCETPLLWPTRTEDRTCPECGTVWEHDGIDLGAGARIKSPAPVPAITYEAELAGRVDQLLPDLTLAERLDLLGAMTPEDRGTCLAWLATAHPQLFDFSIVRDRGLAERLTTLLAADEDEGLDDDEEPYCTTCDAKTGIFHGHGGIWQHFRGEGTTDSPAELFDAGHAPEVAWRPAGAR